MLLPFRVWVGVLGVKSLPGRMALLSQWGKIGLASSVFVSGGPKSETDETIAQLQCASGRSRQRRPMVPTPVGRSSAAA